MTEKELRDMAIKMAENESRSKSNTHQIDEIKVEMGNIKSRQDAIYDINRNIAVMMESLTSVKDDVGELKEGQVELSNKVSIIENQPANDLKKRHDKIIDKSLWLLIGGIICGILYQFIPGFMG